MDQSPYAPPQSRLLAPADSTEAVNSELVDMSAYANSELRELLSNPDLYMPEAVHLAARELAKRSAVPRYYTSLHSQQLGRSFPVTRKVKLDQITALQFIFSETHLKKYCLAIAIIQAIACTIQIIGLARLFKGLDSDQLIKNWPYISASGFAVLSTLIMALFFITLYQSLSSRSIHKI